MFKPTHQLSIIVLAGGFGTRIRESIGDIPKILAPIQDKLFIDFFKLDKTIIEYKKC